MNVKYSVELTSTEREQLQAILSGGCKPVRKVKRAQLLLSADAGHSDGEIAEIVRIGTATIYRTKRRFVEEGLDRALSEASRPGAPRKLNGYEETVLVATACTNPPEGRCRWTMSLLAGRMVTLTEHDSLSSETVRRRLKENELKPWQVKQWCIPTLNAEYVARMEDVLDLYAEDSLPDEPVVCFDESPVQLIGETRTPIPVAPGRPALVDYEYRRNGTANLFVFLNAHQSWRHVKVTDRRTCIDFAECMRDLVDVHYPLARKIRVVMDNLSTHSAAALYKAFAPEEARRIRRRLEFHFTPKHASWLNMVEIEIGVLKRQCLNRRIGDQGTLKREAAAWEQMRNQEKARVKWLFTVEKARQKLTRAYSDLPQENIVKLAA